MAFTVEVREGNSRVIASRVLADDVVQNLPSIDDVRRPVLRFLDEYGDTYFNSLQVRALVGEFAALKAETAGEMSGWRDLEELAELALAEPHRFLVFVGD